MKKLILQVVSVLFFAFSAFGLSAAEYNSDPSNTVIAFNLDRVANDTTVADSVGAVARLGRTLGVLLSHPTLAFKIKGIITKGKETAKEIKGIANIIYNLMHWLEEDFGYKNMVSWTEPLTDAFTNPAPNEHVYALIDQLRSASYTVLFATCHDNIQHAVHRRKMAEKGYDLGKRFDGGACHMAYDIKARLDQEEEPKPDFYQLEHTPGQDTLCVTPAKKTEVEYYQVVQTLANNFVPDANIIFVDNKQEHIAVAETNPKFRGILFNSKEQAIEELREALETQGVQLQEQNSMEALD